MGIHPWGFAKGGGVMLMLGGQVKQGSESNRPSPMGVVRFDHFGFGCTATPGYLLSGLQPEEPGTD